jgi:hypothetical protein
LGGLGDPQQIDQRRDRDLEIVGDPDGLCVAHEILIAVRCRRGRPR